MTDEGIGGRIISKLDSLQKDVSSIDVRMARVEEKQNLHFETVKSNKARLDRVEGAGWKVALVAVGGAIGAAYAAVFK